MHSQELELLMREYRNAETNEDKLIKRKLESIAALCSECKSDEFVFANEITVEFCRVISLLREQHKKSATLENMVVSPAKSDYHSFIAYPNENETHYSCGYELLGAFYNHFKKENEINYYEINGYPFSSETERKEKTNSTLLDYVARIYTFANKYLHEIFSAEIIAASNASDNIIFIYENLEMILAKYNTKDENGVSVKQRVNIRSALRKLNEFKRMQ